MALPLDIDVIYFLLTLLVFLFMDVELERLVSLYCLSFVYPYLTVKERKKKTCGKGICFLSFLLLPWQQNLFYFWINKILGIHNTNGCTLVAQHFRKERQNIEVFWCHLTFDVVLPSFIKSFWLFCFFVLFPSVKAISALDEKNT